MSQSKPLWQDLRAPGIEVTAGTTSSITIDGVGVMTANTIGTVIQHPLYVTTSTLETDVGTTGGTFNLTNGTLTFDATGSGVTAIDLKPSTGNPYITVTDPSYGDPGGNDDRFSLSDSRMVLRFEPSADVVLDASSTSTINMLQGSHLYYGDGQFDSLGTAGESFARILDTEIFHQIGNVVVNFDGWIDCVGNILSDADMRGNRLQAAYGTYTDAHTSTVAGTVGGIAGKYLGVDFDVHADGGYFHDGVCVGEGSQMGSHDGALWITSEGNGTTPTVGSQMTKVITGTFGTNFLNKASAVAFRGSDADGFNFDSAIYATGDLNTSAAVRGVSAVFDGGTVEVINGGGAAIDGEIQAETGMVVGASGYLTTPYFAITGTDNKGQATIGSGTNTVTVSTSVGTGNVVMCNYEASSNSGGALRVENIVDATSFDIYSTGNVSADTLVNWAIIH